MRTDSSHRGEKGVGLLFPVLQVCVLLLKISLKAAPRDRFGDLGEEEEAKCEVENELYQTAMEGGSEAAEEEDAKEEQRKRLSLFSGRLVGVRRNAGFGATGASGRRTGGSAIVQQPGRKPVEGDQRLDQALTVETNRKEVFPAPDVPMSNLRKLVRSPRKNSSRGGAVLASRPSDVATEFLPKFGPNRPPSRIPDFNISQTCIPRHPELRPAVQVRETQITEHGDNFAGAKLQEHLIS